ncbi:recombinase family protein [Hymenobacter glacialis]|uniref:Resolvase n=1 Tax=Hymenobacter glacialis TaxID=1908236 RepID=A0A1G1T1D5_9BACT|nr:recombinase family protein [Hymenobacter glacialis]OGX84694.1 resolvase [Hymenobacter glacialis]
MKTYVAYYRVSTQKQGQSGLGLEAQQAAVASFVGSHATVVAEFIEVESGKKDNRSKLTEAIDQAKRTGSVLLIAKLDRLSRNAGFIFALRDSGVSFQCCDMPDANTLNIGIFAVIAQHEREMISKRTKDALAAKKARGEKLGTPANLTAAGRLKSIEVRKANATAHTSNVQASDIVADKLRLNMTLKAVADHLNAKGYRTRRGGQYSPTHVYRLAKQLAPSS